MGKDIHGNELGQGITQRAWGSYYVRYRDSNGVRLGRNFKTIEECREWLTKAAAADRYIGKLPGSNYSVREWYRFYIDLIKKPILKEKSIRLYDTIFRNHIDPVIGDMRLTAVRPAHCMKVLHIAAGQKLSDITRDKIRSVMRDMFMCALEYNYIAENPVRRNVKVVHTELNKEGRQVLTAEEQKRFLTEARKYAQYPAYALMLQTGMRLGELMSLQWRDISFKKRVIHIFRTGEYRDGEFRVTSPKTPYSRRKIPMTKKSEEILLGLREAYADLPDSEHKKDGYIFLNGEGKIVSPGVYRGVMNRIVKTLGLSKISPHCLRHTFATRCIEAGMQPKTLRAILGHASISITMNLYAHVTKEQKTREVQSVEGRILHERKGD